MMYQQEIRIAITQYMKQVAAHSGNVTPEELIDTLQHLEDHLYAALAERAPTAPTLNDVHAILSEMPAPETFAGEEMRDLLPAEQQEEPHITSSIASMNWEVLLAAMLIPLTSWWALKSVDCAMRFIWDARGRIIFDRVGFILNANTVHYLLLASMGAIAGTILGLYARDKAQKAGNTPAIIQRLSVFVTYFYPILLLNSLIITFVNSYSRRAIGGGLSMPEYALIYGRIAPFVLLGIVFISNVIAYFIIRKYRRVSTHYVSR